MKKITLVILLGLICGFVSAQTYKFKAHSCSYKTYENNRWSDWSEWEETSLLIVFSYDRNVVSIYSSTPQEYDIYDVSDENPTKDKSGGETCTYYAVNEDGLRCALRLRKHKGDWQLYVDFNDAMWVYNIELK